PEKQLRPLAQATGLGVSALEHDTTSVAGARLNLSVSVPCISDARSVGTPPLETIGEKSRIGPSSATPTRRPEPGSWFAAVTCTRVRTRPKTPLATELAR